MKPTLKPIRPDAPTEPDPLQSSELPYELAQQKVQRQLDSADSLDSKATNSLTTAIALVALVAAVLALRSDKFSGGAAVWFYVSLGLLCVVALLFAAATAARKWRTGPHPAAIVEDFRAGTDDATAKWKVVRNLLGSIELNERALTLKRRLLFGSYVAAGAELVAVIVVLVMVAR